MEFVYPTVTTLVPANIGIVTNAPNPQAAEAFVDFLLSAPGAGDRCSIRRSAGCRSIRHLCQGAAGFPNPFKDKSIGAAVKFDVDLSKRRYNVVNSLFDVMITYRLEDLAAAVEGHPGSGGRAAPATDQCRRPRSWSPRRARWSRNVPIDEATARRIRIFEHLQEAAQKGHRQGRAGRQAEIEQEQWDAMVKANYQKARACREGEVDAVSRLPGPARSPTTPDTPCASPGAAFAPNRP